MQLVLYGTLIFLTALLGGVLPLYHRFKSEGALKLFVSLGAGLLLGMAAGHMIPEASHLVPSTFGIAFLGGFLLLFVLERFVMVHACEESGCHYHTVGMAAFAGLGVHGVIEGMALASSLAATALGPIVLVAILAHKVPCGVALTSLLRLSKKSTKQILIFVTGIALSGPLGIVLAQIIVAESHTDAIAGNLLSFSAGTFFYIAACDLLPELHHAHKDRNTRLLVFFLGIGLSLLGGYLVGH